MKQQSVVFESWRGRYADSPRAVSEYLQKTRPEMKLYWVAHEWTELPDGVSRLRRHSPEYFARLFSCDYLITNDIVSKHLVKGPKVTYLQTWHGTPLKTVGFDEHLSTYPGAAAHLKRMVRDVKKWDYLISPSEAATSMLRTAFRFDGPVLETGYPKNDILKSPEAGAVRAKVRRELDIEDAELVVLYAPTWRDDAPTAGGKFRNPGVLDFQLLASLVKPGTVVLNRMHINVSAEDIPAPAGFCRDVSNYQDIADLYLAADVMVSDYSAAIYDFAVTEKPIVLFAHDLASYRDAIRGFYFDYEAWAPGPIVTDTEALADSLNNIGDEYRRHSHKYRDLLERYCPHEDGQATRRVVEQVFNK